MFNFHPAADGEPTVFGASRPGFGASPVPRRRVDEWVAFMRDQGVRRVVCLLDREQVGFYQGDLLQHYAEAFGSENVLWAPIDDFALADAATLTERVLPFLLEAEARGERAVVHCSAGLGRTGQALAAWLVHRRGMTSEAAAAAAVRAGRDPFLAEGAHEAGRARLYALLDACRQPDLGTS